ncbi:unnamed protein product [Dicrocoelium dendriticum]|nr:unnamed protein product [Dicrocoelium dendriticum]
MLFPAEEGILTDNKTWYVTRLCFFTAGLLVNLVLLIVLVRFRKPNEPLLISGIVQTVLDLITCLVCIVDASEYRTHPSFPVYGYLICHLVASHALLWGLIGARMNTIMLTAMFYYVQFLYPFMRIEKRGKSVLIILLIIIPLSILLEGVSNYYWAEFDWEKGSCHLIRMMKDHVAQRAQITLHLTALFNFLYNFFLPMVFSVQAYQQVLRTIRMRSKNKIASAYNEVRLNSLEDVWLVLAFSGVAEVNKLLSQYPNSRNLGGGQSFRTIVIFLMCLYSVIYPCISAVTRRRYKRPILDCWAHIGRSTLDSQLAGKVTTPNVPDRRRMVGRTSGHKSRTRDTSSTRSQLF